jgi:osmoprotectant transport system ATP-binding protein
VDSPERLLTAPADSYVESFLGFDRGIRRLSFLAASGLNLDDTAVISASMPAWEAAERAQRTGEPWLLVTDADQKPRGWVTSDELRSLPREATAGDAQLSRYGHTFGVSTDSLRAALDATLLSPAGRAVGVDEQGRVVGVTSYQRLGAAAEAAGPAADPDAAGGAAGPAAEASRTGTA